MNSGDTYTNPVTGERAVLLTPFTPGTETFESDLFIAPGGQVAGRHVHSIITETFTVVSGTVAFYVDGEERVAEPGETLVVEPGVVHDWWNAGEDEAHVRIRIDGPHETLARFEQMIITIFGLAHEGKVTAKGMPKPLQGAVFASEFADVVQFIKPPIAVQKAAFAILGPIGRARGLRPTYEYHRALVVEPAVAALA